MADRCFVDTNVLVYAAHGDSPKQVTARQLLRDLASSDSLVVSTQVLSEFYSVLTKKVRTDPLMARQLVLQFAGYETVVVDVPLITAAMDCAVMDQLAYWDALIIVAAERSHCRTLYSEDLNSGQIIRGVRVSNPFAD